MTDAADVGRPGDHHGQDGGREEIWAGDVQRGTAGDAAQESPAMSQNDADTSAKVEGIIVQTQADAAGHEGFDTASVLAQRLADAGISLSSEQFDAAVARLGG